MRALYGSGSVLDPEGVLWEGSGTEVIQWSRGYLSHQESAHSEDQENTKHWPLTSPVSYGKEPEDQGIHTSWLPKVLHEK